VPEVVVIEAAAGRAIATAARLGAAHDEEEDLSDPEAARNYEYI